MKRDIDLVRQLMLHFEEQSPKRDSHKQYYAHQTEDQLVLLEHIRLLCQAGFLEGNCDPRTGYAYVRGLTWAGHDFVDSARNDNVWGKVKASLLAVGAWTFDLLVQQLKIEAGKILSGYSPTGELS